MKTILVPTSGTVTAVESAEYAIRVAKSLKAEIHVLHVVTEDKDVESMKESLRSFERAGEESQVAVRGVTAVGNVIDQIIDYAESNLVSLILMGASNGSVVERWLSHEVLAQTAVPVLVMPYQIFDSENDADEAD